MKYVLVMAATTAVWTGLKVLQHILQRRHDPTVIRRRP